MSRQKGNPAARPRAIPAPGGSVVVAVMCWPAMAVFRTLLGLFTMACVTPVSPAPEVRLEMQTAFRFASVGFLLTSRSQDG